MKPVSWDGKLIDLHCDTLVECAKRGVGLQNDVLHLSLDRLPAGYRLCQAMAVFIPDELRGEEALDYFNNACCVLRRELALHRDVGRVTDPGEVDAALERNRWAVLLTVEGGAVLGGRLENLDYLYRQGVRMMTLTWNGENEICGGAATDKGFTPFGRQVVARMESLGMAVDVSHLSDRGFYELCAFARRPFLASHSNARAVCAHRRNLTDGMFRMIAERGGVVGLNYYTEFIREGGDTRSMDDLLRHVHHFLALGGEKALALGSDFDGADMPPYLAGLHQVGDLAEALLRSGIPEDTAADILYGNARRYLREFASETAAAQPLP